MDLVLNTGRNVPFFSCGRFDRAGGVAHGFSTRLGGVSTGIYDSLNLGGRTGDDPDRVEQNLNLLCQALGTDPSGMVCNTQVHGDRIRPVTRADFLLPCQADGLITDQPGLCLTVFSADCIPVLLYDPVRRCIAAVHSGWRGTALAISARAVEQMVGLYGCRPTDILAAVGPGICPVCFETHADVPDAMTDALGPLAAPFIRPLNTGKYQVDLKGIIGRCLLDAGLVPEHIAVSSQCSCCRPDLFWSHRRQGPRRGSMAAMIQLL